MGGTIIFITGGARSGKSSYAEQLAMHLSGRLRYVATAHRSDTEMIERINQHIKLRLSYDKRWETNECPLLNDLDKIMFSREDIVLLDCLTILMANELYQTKRKVTTLEAENQLLSKIKETFLKLAKQVKTLIIVSNELLYEGYEMNDVVQQYRRILGRLHEKIIKDASIAILVEAGQPVVMKGRKLLERRFIN